jgi:hypothetical protein
MPLNKMVLPGTGKWQNKRAGKKSKRKGCGDK